MALLYSYTKVDLYLFRIYLNTGGIVKMEETLLAIQQQLAALASTNDNIVARLDVPGGGETKHTVTY